MTFIWTRCGSILLKEAKLKIQSVRSNKHAMKTIASDIHIMIRNFGGNPVNYHRGVDLFISEFSGSGKVFISKIIK